MKPITGSFAVSEQDSADFAALSGDVNPLHVDSTYARRLQFGTAVVHGVHHMLRALDHSLDAWAESAASRVHGIAVTFPNPVRCDREVSWKFDLADDGQRAELNSTCDGLRVLQASLRLGEPRHRLSEGAQAAPTLPPPMAPAEQLFPPVQNVGDVPLHCDRHRAQALFPRLLAAWGPDCLAELLACTYVVGMRLPGLHSVFSGLDLALGAVDNVCDPSALHYSVDRADARFKMVRIAVDGAWVKGSLEAFFRPGPTEQVRYAQVVSVIDPGLFADQRALVVGGSRGVGETTAKILAAGGAEVCISYHSGREDALKVAGEIVAGGGKCTSMQLDVSADTAVALAHFTADSAPDHVYYFASGRITPNRTRRWNPALFASYSRMYLQAFSDLVEPLVKLHADTGRTVTFYYPSSVYVSEPEKGFAEYAAAKAAGEVLCEQLAKLVRNTRFLTPRLPRMATDQTSSIIAVQCESTFDVMHRELTALASAA